MNTKPMNLSICLITYPLSIIQGGHALVEKFLRILEPLVTDVFLITSNYPQSAVFSYKIHLNNVNYEPKKQLLPIRIIRHLRMQIVMALKLATICKRTGIVIYFAEGTTLLLPMLTAKLMGKKVMLVATGSGKKGAQQQFKSELWGTGSFVFSEIVGVLEGINRSMSNVILVESPSLVSWLNLERYQKKVSSEGGLFVNTDLFFPKTKLDERKNAVGFFGRFSGEKGIMNFAKAIPLILDQCDEIEFLIGGDGPLFREVKDLVGNLAPRVRIIGWVPYEQLPDFLNEVKLVVIPSYTEGLPNIMLEAMACGTPVLATAVGGIIDVIEDKKTGLILKNNSPGCITENVIRALANTNLIQISCNARYLVESKYSFQASLNRYRTLLRGLLK